MTFGLNDLFIVINEVLKFPAIIVLLLVSPFISVNNCFIYFGAVMLGGIFLVINVMSSW